ncbi:hypothetical protein Dda_5848 [Drechslerella dactyloides]|uniref:Uncharacterized protein n=1 Tax=Drechslerella dactyloides TaxID=74499 RepID=A0AAD6NJE6_DREDA|nr:hypothetical protein Dda_5848 [Drechslerella dactyloides]
MSSHWEDGTNDADTSFKAITAYDGRQPRQPPDSGQRRDGKSWSDLSSYTMQISVDGFSRMSAAGVDGLTLSVGQGLLGVFKLSELGERRVQTAVEKLTKRRAFHKGLVFGFGSRHLVRSVTKTAEGLSCVALCASMGEFYGRDTCASILRELLNLAFHPPPHLSPSLRQWALMIEAFQGTLAVSDFGALCGKMYQAYRSCGMDERVSISRPQRGLLMPPAGSTKQIAQALVGLMKLTEGTMRAMTLTGGPDCVWFAVVAEWLFGLNVLMKNDRTGQEREGKCLQKI